MRKLSLLALALSAVALASAPMSVDSLIRDADKHDGKEVVVRGVVSEFRERTSRAGNLYSTLKLRGKTELNGFTRGKVEPAPGVGDTVEITGIYRKEKKLPTFTVQNEVDFTKVQGKKYGLKIVRKANRTN